MSDSSDGDTSKGWTLVDQDDLLEDIDDGASSSSSCDVALDEDVVRFRHTPRRSSSVSNGNPTTPTNLTVSTDGSLMPKTPTNPPGASSLPANFWVHPAGRDTLASSGQGQLSPNVITASACNANPSNQWPQGARPKTTNGQINPQSPSMNQSSSSTSTIIEEDRSERESPCRNLPMSTSSHLDASPDGDFEEEELDDSDAEEDMIAAQVSDEKADTSSMSSIEILNMPSDEWSGNTGDGEHVESASYQVMQPLLSSSALIPDQSSIEPVEMKASGHHTTSDSDSDFVRVDQSMVQEANAVQQDAPLGPENDDNDEDAEYGEAAAASPVVEEHHHHLNDSFRTTAPLSVSSYSLPCEASSVSAQYAVEDLGHRRHRHQRRHHFPEDEEGDVDDVPGPSHRPGGDEVLGRRYFARRLQREMSMSVSSSASDLSSFSFLGLRHQSSRNSINRQHSDDMSEISSVFTDGSDDLPANMMIGTTKPAPKQYKHKRAERLNAKLNYLVLLVLASVFALGIGHYIGSYQEKYYRHQIREGQVKRLRELQDDLITCLDKRTTKTDDKATFAGMVMSLLGNNIKQDEVLSDVAEEEEDLTVKDFSIDCSTCSEANYRYSETCNSLCVQGGFWAELDEAISDLPIPTPEDVSYEEDAPTVEAITDNVILLDETSDEDNEVTVEDESAEVVTGSENAINLELEKSDPVSQSEKESKEHEEQQNDSIDDASFSNIEPQNSDFPSQHEEPPKINEEIPSQHEEPPKINEEQEDDNNADETYIYEDWSTPTTEQKTYSYDEVVMMENKLKRKEHKLEEEESGFIAEKVILMPQTIAHEEVINKVDIEDDDDDEWIQIEIEDDDSIVINVIHDTEDPSETIQQKVEDDIFVNEEVPMQDESEQSQINNTAPILNDMQEDTVTKARLEELQEQLLMAQNRADMWRRKFVEEHHHKQKPHPEVIILDKQDEQETESSEDLGSYKRIEELEEQLNLAKARADMWQSLYVDNFHTDEKPTMTAEDNIKSDDEPKPSSKEDSTHSKDSKERSQKDTCGPLGCFNVFENILTNFLNSVEGKEFLRFANLSQVLNNATFWEEFVSATNISAYTISDAVYQSWVEFQDYVKSAQTNDFISSFSAVLTRAGKSVASAFGTVKNYSSTMGDTAQSAWNSMRNFTSDTVDRHNINLSNISRAAQDAFEKVKNMSADSKVSGSVQDVWNTMRNFSEDAFRGQNLSLYNLKEKVAAAWNTVRNMSAQVVSNDTKMKFSDVADQVTENVKTTMQDTWKSVKDVVREWHPKRKQHKKQKNKEKWHQTESEDTFGKADENEDPSQEKRSRKHTRTGSPHAEEQQQGNDNNKKQQHVKQQEKCKGKKCNSKKHEESKPKYQRFGPENIKDKKNKHQKHRDDEKQTKPKEDHGHGHRKGNKHRDRHHHGKHERHHQQQEWVEENHHENHHQFHHQKHHTHKGKHSHGQNRNDRKDKVEFSSQFDLDWEEVLDVFNMNCYGNADCLSHQRRDAAKLYEELTEYKKWLKAHQRKKELKQVRKFLDALGEFLSEPVLDDEDLKDLKEDFEEVLEHVGRFVQDQHERSSFEESEENSTVILDLDLLKKEQSEESSQSVPERRKFAGFGYQSSGDDDNWFLKRGKDREEHHQDEWNDENSEDDNWYLQWMQGRTDSRTGVTVWDMYRWITDRFSQRKDLRQYDDDINWFLKRP